MYILSSKFITYSLKYTLSEILFLVRVSDSFNFIEYSRNNM